MSKATKLILTTIVILAGLFLFFFGWFGWLIAMPLGMFFDMFLSEHLAYNLGAYLGLLVYIGGFSFAVIRILRTPSIANSKDIAGEEL